MKLKPRNTWICAGCGTEFNNRSQTPPQGWRWNGDALTCADCSGRGPRASRRRASPRTEGCSMTFPPFPLVWPDGLPRTERKATSQFRTSLNGACDNVRKSLAAFGNDTGKKVGDVAITSNMGGITFEPPSDTGVAIWFTWEGAQRCIAVDRYPKVEDNLQAIHHVLEARRTELRHGGLHIVRQTFKGFVALPAPAGARSWREVLGFTDPSVPVGGAAAIDARYRELAAKAHPDKGGTAEAMHELNRARAEAKAALS